jgi:NADPH:quinone reductase-like Zn-dependent oxidoreductase
MAGKKCCSLNYRDLAIVTGAYTAPAKEALVLLSDGAGEVVESGGGVDSLGAGDRTANTFFLNWDDRPYQSQYWFNTLAIRCRCAY